MNDSTQRSQATREPSAGDSTVLSSTKLALECSVIERDEQCFITQVVREFVGYARVWWAQILYRILVLLSLGLVWALGFYTVHASLWTLRECALSQAEFVCVRVSVLNRQTGYLVSLFVYAQSIKSFISRGAAHHRTP